MTGPAIALPHPRLHHRGHDDRSASPDNTLSAVPAHPGPPRAAPGRLRLPPLRQQARAEVGALLRPPAVQVLWMPAHLQHVHRDRPPPPEAGRALASVSVVRGWAPDRTGFSGRAGCRQGYRPPLATPVAGTVAERAQAWPEGPRRHRTLHDAPLRQGRPGPGEATAISWGAVVAFQPPDPGGDGAGGGGRPTDVEPQSGHGH